MADHIEYDVIGNPVKIGHYDKSSDEWRDGYELTWNGRQLISYQYFEYYGEDDYYYGTTIEYTYNADGIRTSKTVDGMNGEASRLSEGIKDHGSIKLPENSGILI